MFPPGGEPHRASMSLEEQKRRAAFHLEVHTFTEGDQRKNENKNAANFAKMASI